MSLTDGIDARTAATGAVTGVGTYLLGYLFMYVTQQGSVEERFSAFNAVTDLLGGDPIPVWQGVGWLFYNAHFVAIRVPGIGGSTTQNVIADADGSVSTLLYLLPPVILVGAGYAVASLSTADVPAMSGVFTVVGYLPLAILGVVLFSYSVGDGVIEPDAVTAVALAGIVYPAVFGAIGGAVAGRF